ncbi:MAG: serine/threonine protein kinase [Streptosporangiaceae bacterium]|nr:serine/threonine protein kinase [Streptosporangiaceae bacterium]
MPRGTPPRWDDHPLVLECRHKEAGCLAGLGRTREALAHLQALLPDFERVYGPTGEQTLDLRHEICRLLAVTGRPDLAWPLAAALLIDIRNTYGDDHPETRSVQDLLDKLDQLKN